MNRFGKFIYANTHSLGKYIKFNDDPFENSDHTSVDKNISKCRQYMHWN